MGQIVPVVREAGHSAFSERQWIIDLPDQTRGSIPFSWAVPVNDQGESFADQAGTLSGVQADVTTLLNLARMVRRLMEDQLEEVEFDGADPDHNSARKEERPTAYFSNATSSVGATTGSESARDDCGAGGDADQADAKPLPGREEPGT